MGKMTMTPFADKVRAALEAHRLHHDESHCCDEHLDDVAHQAIIASHDEELETQKKLEMEHLNEILESNEVVRGTENQNLRSLIRELGEALCTSSHEDNDNNCPNNFPHQGDCSACEGRIKRGEAYAKIPKELRS